MRKYNIHWIIKKIGRLELADFQNLNPPIDKKNERKYIQLNCI